MVAGKGKLKNKFRDGKGPFLEDATPAYIWVWTLSCEFLFIPILIFLFALIIDIGDVFEFRNKNEPTWALHTKIYADTIILCLLMLGSE